MRRPMVCCLRRRCACVKTVLYMHSPLEKRRGEEKREASKRGLSKMQNSQKPPIPTPNRDIHNQIKLLIKRRPAIRARRPRIRKQRVIDEDVCKVTPRPEVLGRVLALDPDVQHLLQPAVEVRVHVVARPLEAEGVEALGEVGAADLTAGGGAPEGVEVGGWACGGC
jgi:hypothetical protein